MDVNFAECCFSPLLLPEWVPEPCLSSFRLEVADDELLAAAAQVQTSLVPPARSSNAESGAVLSIQILIPLLQSTAACRKVANLNPRRRRNLQKKKNFLEVKPLFRLQIRSVFFCSQMNPLQKRAGEKIKKKGAQTNQAGQKGKQGDEGIRQAQLLQRIRILTHSKTPKGGRE